MSIPRRIMRGQRKEYPMVSGSMYKLGTAVSPIRAYYELGWSRAEELGRENIFDFSLGAPAVPMPDAYRRELIRLLEEEDQVRLHTYAPHPGVPETKKAITDDLNRRFGCSFDPGDIIMTAGAAPAISAVLSAIKTSPSDEIALLAPYFSEYSAIIEGLGLKKLEIKTLEPDFHLDLDAIERALGPDTAALLLNSPNNPSGAVYPAEDLKRLAEILKSKSEEFGRTIFLISDEPYRELMLEDEEFPFPANFYDDTVICYSYSKSLSIAGERMGYVLIPGANGERKKLFPAVMGAARANGVSNAPVLFQKALIKCAGLSSDTELYRKNRDVLYDALTSMGYICTKPKATFYMMVKTLEDDRAFCERAAGMGLIFAPCSGFGFPGYVRVALCVPEDTAKRSVGAFRRLLDSYRQ